MDIQIEASAPCDGADTLIAVGTSCFPVTTAPVTDLMVNANFSSSQIPQDGEAVIEGVPLTCSDIRASGVSGLEARGAANFFGSPVGDLVVELFAKCQ